MNTTEINTPIAKVLEASVEKEIQKSIVSKEKKLNKNLKMISDYILVKGKSVLLSGVGLLLFAGFWSLVSQYTNNELPGPAANVIKLRIFQIVSF